jgi:flagellar protein FliJ
VTRFRFRLEPVLDHRERIERERAAEHARKLAEQLEAQRVLDELIARRDATRAKLTREHTTIDATMLRAAYAHLEYLDRAIIATQRRVDACADETERARLDLVGAAKDRKVLETLKDRRREAFELDAALADQREMDDLNARLFERAHPFEGKPS